MYHLLESASMPPQIKTSMKPISPCIIKLKCLPVCLTNNWTAICAHDRSETETYEKFNTASTSLPRKRTIMCEHNPKMFFFGGGGVKLLTSSFTSQYLLCCGHKEVTLRAASVCRRRLQSLAGTAMTLSTNTTLPLSVSLFHGCCFFLFLSPLALLLYHSTHLLLPCVAQWLWLHVLLFFFPLCLGLSDFLASSLLSVFIKKKKIFRI